MTTTEKMFLKEWNAAQFETMNRAIAKYFRGKIFNTMHKGEYLFDGSISHLETILGLPYTSTSMYAMKGVTNTEVYFDAEKKYKFVYFVLSEKGVPYAALWDKDENELFIRLQ